MQDLVVSLSENILKVSTVEGGEFKGVSAEVSSDVVNNYEILNTEEIVSALRDLISAVTKKGYRGLSLNFIVEPYDVITHFITVNKNGEDRHEQIISEIRAKVTELPLEEMYFSYIKVAPFVYQFIGVRKEKLEKLIEVSNKLGIGLKSAFPWTLFLPKMVGTNKPAIFISKLADKQVVALSEFGGIFFSGIYEKEKSTEELQKLVEELAGWLLDSLSVDIAGPCSRMMTIAWRCMLRLWYWEKMRKLPA